MVLPVVVPVLSRRNRTYKTRTGESVSGGGPRGRGVALCLGRPGLNPGMDLGAFSIQKCCQSILTGCQAFSNNV